MTQGYKEGGLNKDKYTITKGDGSECSKEAEYFVLRIDKDPHAMKALEFYAGSVRDDNELLSTDIMNWVDKVKKRIETLKDMYGVTAQDWLDKWDNQSYGVWSIEMGGMGPAYEQAIQITMVEFLRELIKSNFDFSVYVKNENKDVDTTDADELIKAIEDIVTNRCDHLGLSGVQFGAAKDLACKMYVQGPYTILTDPVVKDRHIQVRKNFPSAPENK